MLSTSSCQLPHIQLHHANLITKSVINSNDYTNDITLVILYISFHVAAGSVCCGNPPQHTSCPARAVEFQGDWLKNEWPICLIFQRGANKELCKHCTVSTLLGVILFDSLQCLIRSSSPPDMLTGKETGHGYFTFITVPSVDGVERLAICLLMSQQNA